MPPDFIVLKCKSCGANLEIYSDTDHFACAYCQTEMIVRRRGGIVSLNLVTEAIKKVQQGTDKTAAELALQRLGVELTQLEKLRAEEMQTRFVLTILGGGGMVMGLLVLCQIFARVFEWISSHKGSFICFILAFIIITACAYFSREVWLGKRKKSENDNNVGFIKGMLTSIQAPTRLEQSIKVIRQRIAENKQIVDGE